MYTVDYFIDKFKKIPEEKWYVGAYVNPCNVEQRCALGHCIVKDGEFVDEVDILQNLMVNNLNCAVGAINDGRVREYQQPTPKQRILAALRDIKKMNEEQEDKRSVASKEKSELPYADKTKKFTELIPVVDETADCEIKIVH